MIGETSPETVNGLINAWLTICELIDQYGPVTVATAIPAAGFLIGTRISDRRRTRRDGIRRLEHFANHPANRSRKEKP